MRIAYAALAILFASFFLACEDDAPQEPTSRYVFPDLDAGEEECTDDPLIFCCDDGPWYMYTDGDGYDQAYPSRFSYCEIHECGEVTIMPHTVIVTNTHYEWKVETDSDVEWEPLFYDDHRSYWADNFYYICPEDHI